MLTLRKLKEYVQQPDDQTAEPSYRQLQESGVPVLIQRKMGEEKDTVLTVYRNGYVVYQIDRHITVFPLDMTADFSNYLADVLELQPELDSEFFEDAEWYLLPMLIGEKRIQHNQNEKEQQWSFSMTKCFSEGYLMRQRYDQDLEGQVIQKIQVEELLDSLNERQREAILLKYWEEKGQKQIAENMGMKYRQSANNMLSRALQNLRKHVSKDKD